ncbi:AAA family ATPase [Schumannella sp. 10F1B-5-1]|uniref:AAA family ATPase n=1 Tax=Schumannella sp. 10F1B-5-1 TaxID=2590780 RepID=UPI001131B79A|nr:AAA family ATPase [Schumannella sp. 10F1B-5-1]TPW70725.1 AAA family ATPase [Schumannella sp. 10F1B-5-1]
MTATDAASTTGLVIGKFYPPHLGHLDLIERAAGEVDELAVLVLASVIESIPLADRVAWLRDATSALPGVRVIGLPDDGAVDYDSEAAWVAESARMAAAVAAHGIPQPDVVFTSEGYGEELARRLGARAVTHDTARARVRVSGTAVRADLVETWPLLPEATRRGLATRVIVVGAESTGTTTMAEALATHYAVHPRWPHPGLASVPEYGREFTYALHARTAEAAAAEGRPAPSMDDLVWLPEHFGHIASEQNAREDAAALRSPLVIGDTDAFATTLWERRYVGEHSIQATTAGGATLPRRDLYLVTDHVDVPFEDDGWRDGEHVRPTMTGWFVDELTRRGASWILLRGSHEQRFAYAIRAVDALLEHRRRFTSPPWDQPTVLV